MASGNLLAVKFIVKLSKYRLCLYQHWEISHWLGLKLCFDSKPKPELSHLKDQLRLSSGFSELSSELSQCEMPINRIGFLYSASSHLHTGSAWSLAWMAWNPSQTLAELLV